MTHTFRKLVTGKSIFFGFIIILSFVLSSITVLAGTTTLTGTISAGDSDRDLASGAFYSSNASGLPCRSTSYPQPVYSHEYFVEVTVSGTYTIDVNNLAVFDGTLGSLWDADYASSNCLVGFWTDFTNSVTVTLNEGTIYRFNIWLCESSDCADSEGSYDITFSGPGDILARRIGEPEPVVAQPQPAAPEGLPAPAFTDERINNYDAAAPVAVYPHIVNGERGLVFYDVNGVLLLDVSASELAAAPDNPAAPVLIAQGNGVVLSRIGTENGGRWQVNAPQYNGKTYVLIFKELFANGGYTSFEID